MDIEIRACTAVGDEFYARLDSGDTGLAPAEWLRALVEETGARLQAAIVFGTDDWRALPAFLRCLAGSDWAAIAAVSRASGSPASAGRFP